MDDIWYIHRDIGFDMNQFNLSACHTGLPVVKYQSSSARSYTCELQQATYADNPRTYSPDAPYVQQGYAIDYKQSMHPSLFFAQEPTVPAELLELANELVPLSSKLFKQRRTLYTLVQGDSVILHLHLQRAVLHANCEEPIRDTLYLQLLRDSPVV